MTKNTIYVKVQPQDWSQDGKITSSYMENWYIMGEDSIEIRNRFTDFSGWEHPYNAQELPAFYTVSYLDSFVCYTGQNPWSNGSLTYFHNLGDWGSGSDGTALSYRFRQSNTETWCAWFNSERDFGLGLFVPNVDMFLGGRYAYNGTTNPKAISCGYVAPHKAVKLVSYQSLEYRYLLTTGSVADIRETFTRHKDFTTNEGLTTFGQNTRLPDDNFDMTNLDFTLEDRFPILVDYNYGQGEYDAKEQAVKITVNGGGYDPFVYLDFQIGESTYRAEDYRTIEIVCMIPESNSHPTNYMQLFLATGDTATAIGGNSVGTEVISDGEYHTLSFDVSNLSFWSGVINKIRIDYFGEGANGDVIYIKSITLK